MRRRRRSKGSAGRRPGGRGGDGTETVRVSEEQLQVMIGGAQQTTEH